MKHKILKFSTVILLFVFIGASCQKDEIEYADESITVSNRPWVNIYKTKRNYLNYIAVAIDSLGNIISSPDYIYGNPIVGKKNNGDVYFTNRHILKSGYIVAYEDFNSAFTDITLKKYIDYNKQTGLGGWSDELILPRIIDDAPYSEFYYMACLTCPLKEFTLGEINEMLENGTIEEHFTRLK